MRPQSLSDAAAALATLATIARLRGLPGTAIASATMRHRLARLARASDAVADRCAASGQSTGDLRRVVGNALRATTIDDVVDASERLANALLRVASAPGVARLLGRNASAA